MPALNVILTGARGGQGTSTIAAALAISAAGHGMVQLVAEDLSATAALLGLCDPLGEQVAVTDRLTLTGVASDAPDVRIVDAGRASPSGRIGGRDLHLVVLRGPCYVALQSLLRRHEASPDGIVLLAEPRRSLTAQDVEDVTGVPVVARVAVSPTVARTIDAGLLVARLHRLRDLASLRRYATCLLRPEAPDTPACALPGAPAVPVAGLNESCPRNPVKIGTDLPVPLSGTGRGLPRRRARGCQRAFPPRTETSGRSCAEYRQAQWRCCGVLHRRGRLRG